MRCLMIPNFRLQLLIMLSLEMLAQAALQAELLVCAASGVKHDKYIGRSQYPRIQNKPARYKHCMDDKFTSPAANFWGVLAHMLELYIKLRAGASVQGTVYCSLAVEKSEVEVPCEDQCARALKTKRATRPNFLKPF